MLGMAESERRLTYTSTLTARSSGAGFEHHVERPFAGATHPAEPRVGEQRGKPLLPGLRTHCLAHFLRQRRRHADHRPRVVEHPSYRAFATAGGLVGRALTAHHTHALPRPQP